MPSLSFLKNHGTTLYIVVGSSASYSISSQDNATKSLVGGISKRNDELDHRSADIWNMYLTN